MTDTAAQIPVDVQREVICSVLWALERMIEIRKAGGNARFRICWLKRPNGVREYRLEIKHADGRIERPVFPFPLTGAQSVVEGDVE